MRSRLTGCLPVRPVLGMERRAIEGELGRRVRMRAATGRRRACRAGPGRAGSGRGRGARRRHRRGQPLGHQRAVAARRSSMSALAIRNRVAGGRVAERRARPASRPACSPGRTLPSTVATVTRRVTLLDLPPGPEERLDDLLGLDAERRRSTGRGRPSPPWSPTRWHERQANCGEAKTAAPRPESPCSRASAIRAATWAASAERSGRPRLAGGGGGRHGRARLGRGPGGLALELGHQPVEAVEVVAQPLLGVVHGVAEDADRPAVAAVADGPQQLEVAARPGPAAGSSARCRSPPGSMPLRFTATQVGHRSSRAPRRSGRGGRGRGAGCRRCRRW